MFTLRQSVSSAFFTKIEHNRRLSQSFADQTFSVVTRSRSATMVPRKHSWTDVHVSGYTETLDWHVQHTWAPGTRGAAIVCSCDAFLRVVRPIRFMGDLSFGPPTAQPVHESGWGEVLARGREVFSDPLLRGFFF